MKRRNIQIKYPNVEIARYPSVKCCEKRPRRLFAAVKIFGYEDLYCRNFFTCSLVLRVFRLKQLPEERRPMSPFVLSRNTLSPTRRPEILEAGKGVN